MSLLISENVNLDSASKGQGESDTQGMFPPHMVPNTCMYVCNVGMYAGPKCMCGYRHIQKLIFPEFQDAVLSPAR